MNPAWLPVVAAQALWLRATIDLASAPGGGTSGTAPTPTPGPAGEPLHIAVLGDSTAAGCGVTGGEEAFAAAFALELAARTRRPAVWQVAAQFGATSRRIRYRLVPRLGANLDLVVLLAGVNDIMAARSPAAWRTDLTGILTDLQGHTSHVVMAGIPPFTRFPAIPGKLAAYLTERAQALDEVSRHLCGRSPAGTTFIPAPTETPPPGFFSTDDFHPSAEGYRYWAQHLATRTPVPPAPTPGSRQPSAQ